MSAAHLPSPILNGEPPRRPVPLVVVSPHPDDAVFSCGGLLLAHPGSVVVTVYTGLPDSADMSTEWDRRCGFSSAAEAMDRRLEEERQALQCVGSTGQALGFIDSQYRQGRDESVTPLAERLLHALAGLSADRVALPLGLFHDDHLRVSEAGLQAWQACPGVSWFFYEDVPYRNRSGAVQDRLAQLRDRGVELTPAQLETEPAGKAEAVAAYASQLRGLGGWPGDGQAERYWRVAAKRASP